jgi:hypothetical protein
MQKYKSNITTTSGAALRNVPVEVIAENGTQAALFLDREGTVPAANPLRTGADGTFYFYAVNGRYSLKTTVEGATITDRDVVLLMDPEEITVAGPIAEAVAAAEAAAIRAEDAVEDSEIPALVEAVQNAVVDVNTRAGIAAAKAGEAAASAGAAQGYSDSALGYKNEANASKNAAAGSAAAAATSATNAGNSANAAAASAASIAGGPVASLVGLTGAITQAQFNTTVAPGLPISTATQTALNAKANLAGAAFTGNVDVSKAAPSLGLSRTTDAQTAQVSILNAGVMRWGVGMEAGAPGSYFIARHNDAGAYVDTPFSINRSNGIANFLYTPAAPTAAAGDSSTKLATTAFAAAIAALKANLSGAAFTGSISTTGDVSVANSVYVGGSGNGRLFGKNSSGVAVMEAGVTSFSGYGDSVGFGSIIPSGQLDFGTNSLSRVTIMGNGDTKVNYGRLLLIGHPTTASAANCYIDAGGLIYRSTSSARYKKDVEDLDESIAESIYGMRPVWFRSTNKDDPEDWSWLGLIAEEVAQVEPRLAQWAYLPDAWNPAEDVVTYDEDGNELRSPGKATLKEGAQKVPDGVQYDRFVVPLIACVKRQRADIAALLARVEALESKQ